MSCPACKTGPKSKRRRYLSLAVWVLLAGAVLGVAIAPASDRPGTVAAGPIRVEVSDRGFSPSSVTLAPGAPVELEFLRTTDETCASSVAFPELGISEPLALNKPVRFAIPVSQPRTLSFQCGVGNYRSAVIIN